MFSTRLIMSNPWIDNNNTIIDKKIIRDENANNLEKLVKIAISELREDEHTKRQCLEHLRCWIKQNQDLENCFTDDNFLLRFLRVKKFSIPMAEQTLLKYLNFRKRFNYFMFDMDYHKSSLIRDGYIFVSPIRDANGRRVIIYNVNKIDPQKHTGNEIALAHAITYETLIADEENQILGVNHVGDVNGLNSSFLTLWSITEFATIIRWGEQSFPMRHREVNVLNFPTSFKYVFEFITSNLRSEKLKNRISFHDSLPEMHKKVDKNCLPLEFGGVIPTKDMLELWKKELADKRELLLSYDVMNLLSDRGIIRRSTPACDETGVGSLPGSFRKLEVD